MAEGRWFRFYEQVVNDIKVQRLSEKLFKAWVNILCLASANGGYLPNEDEIAFSLRLTAAGTGGILDQLYEANLIESTEDGRVRPHNWNGRQYKSDVSTTRVKEFRKRRGNVSPTVSATPPETDSTDTETERPPVVPRAGDRTQAKLDFDDFWKTYPKRCGTNSKAKALEKFVLIVKQGIDPAAIIAGAESYAAHCDAERKTNTEFVQQATTWLNQQGWQTDYGRRTNGIDHAFELIDRAIGAAEGGEVGGSQGVVLLSQRR